MCLSREQYQRTLDALRGYHLLLKRLSELSHVPEARMLVADCDSLLTELEMEAMSHA